MPSLQFLEQVSRVAPLGVRFRDETTGRFVGDGLVVNAWPAAQPSLRRQAVVNHSSVWVLQDLPGLRELEFGAGDASWWASLPPRKRFTVEVYDASGRFLPFSFQAELPFRGLFELDCITGSPLSPLSPLSPPSHEPAVPLFSAPARQAEPTLAVLRAELWDESARAPASWARLESTLEGGPPVHGVADAQGRVVLFFQYPEPEDFAPGSPGDGSAFPRGPPPQEQAWKLQLTAFYTRRAPAPGFPDLCDTLAQLPARLWADLSGGQNHLECTLHFGQQLVVRTQGEPLSRLRLTPAGSPP